MQYPEIFCLKSMKYVCVLILKWYVHETERHKRVSQSLNLFFFYVEMFVPCRRNERVPMPWLVTIRVESVLRKWTTCSYGNISCLCFWTVLVNTSTFALHKTGMPQARSVSLLTNIFNRKWCFSACRRRVWKTSAEGEGWHPVARSSAPRYALPGGWALISPLS